MMHYLTDEARAALVNKLAEIDTALATADAFARNELSAAAARLTALREARNRLGNPPALDAFVTASDWRQATDQHTFDSSHCDREIADAEQVLNARHDEHNAISAAVPILKQQLRKMALDALDDETVRRTREAAEIAHVRQSLFNRIPFDQRDTVSIASAAGPIYQVQNGGFADLSFFQARIICDGFGPEKSAAFISELGQF
jgi:hypothetical protein